MIAGKLFLVIPSTPDCVETISNYVNSQVNNYLDHMIFFFQHTYLFFLMKLKTYVVKNIKIGSHFRPFGTLLVHFWYIFKQNKDTFTTRGRSSTLIANPSTPLSVARVQISHSPQPQFLFEKTMATSNKTLLEWSIWVFFILVVTGLPTFSLFLALWYTFLVHSPREYK